MTIGDDEQESRDRAGRKDRPSVAQYLAPSLTRQVAITLVTNVVLLAIALLTGGLAARLLGPAGRGELAAIQNWSLVLASLGSLGLPQAVVFFTGRESERSGQVLGSAMASLLALCLPVVGLGYLFMPWFLQAQSWHVVEEARIYLLLIPVQFLGVPFYSLQGRNSFIAWNLLRSIGPFLWLGVLLLALATGHRTPVFVARSYLLSLAVLTLAMGWWIVTRQVPGPYRPDTHLAGRMLEFGLPATLTAAPQLLSSRMDQLLMAALVSPETLGLYVVAAIWGGSVIPVFAAVASVVFPRVASSPDVETGREMFTTAVRFSTLLAVPIGMLFALCVPFALPLVFGPSFLRSVSVALVLGASGVIQGLNQILEAGLQGLGMARMPAIAESVGLGLSVAILLLLLPVYPLMGAAIASVITASTTLLLLLRYAQRVTGCSFRTLLVIRHTDLTIACAWLSSSFRKW